MSRLRHVVHARKHKHDGGAALHKGIGPHATGKGFAGEQEEKDAEKDLHNVMGGKAKVRAHRKHGGKVKHSDHDADDGYAKGGKAGHFIQKAIKHPGALHKALHVPQGEKIPEKKLKKAEHSSNPTMRKRAHLAETLKKMHH